MPSYTHGHAAGVRSPEYKSWRSMLSRCANPNDPAYDRYGGRGIEVCERWRVFEQFLEDMGARPADRTLERLNNDKGYEPGNCVWATRDVQAYNKRSTKQITIGGLTDSLAGWCRLYKLDPAAVRWRQRHLGWSVHRAILTPKGRSHAVIAGI